MHGKKWSEIEQVNYAAKFDLALVATSDDYWDQAHQYILCRQSKKRNEYSVAPVTCLVGKNESGKTNILEAIYKLNPDIPERGNFTPIFDYPRRKLSEYLARARTHIESD